jgi:hypothetical protein
MNWASFWRGRTAGAVMSGSAGTPAIAKAEKRIVETAERAYRQDIISIRFSVVQDERTRGVAERADG